MNFPARPPDVRAFGRALRQARKAIPDLTLDVLAAKSKISKPYLSNIETGRIPGPPSEGKLRLLARALGLEAGQVLAAADWLRAPASMRKAMLGMGGNAAGETPRRGDGAVDLDRLMGRGDAATRRSDDAATRRRGDAGRDNSTHGDMIAVAAVPLINRVAAGRAGEFGDLSYPAGVADAYVAAPDLPEAPAAALFAVRVAGDSMLPEYREGDILIVGPGEARDGDDCVVRLGAGENFATTFKRVFFEKVEGEVEAVRLVPLNPAHAERRVAAEEVTGIYPLIYRMVPRRMGKGAGVKASEKLKG